MKQVTVTGQTVEQAIESALSQLKAERDDVEIRVIDQGKKGLFGVFGSRLAKVEATLKVKKDTELDPVEEAEKFLVEVIKNMGVEASVDCSKIDNQIIFQLAGEKIAILIGKRGQTLNSLQYLTQLVVNKYTREYVTVVVDAENYRERRKETLIQLANRLSDKAIQTKRAVHLEPMPSFERKIIHTALYNQKGVKTISSGEEPNRYVVIKPNI